MGLTAMGMQTVARLRRGLTFDSLAVAFTAFGFCFS